mgnify:FL=1
MRPRNRYITVVAVLIGMAAFVIGIIGTELPRIDPGPPCWKEILPAQIATECWELEAQKASATFPWDRQRAEAQDFFRQFQTSVAADRREEVAEMMMYPLRVKYYTDPRPSDYRFLRSPGEMLEAYDMVFHQSVKDYIANYDAGEVWGNDYFLQTGTGQIGIYCTTTGECPECSFEFKVKIIHSNLIYRDPVDEVMEELVKPNSTP